MDGKYTPGPWQAVYVGCSDWDLNGPVTEQDWKLAAAAPDLLEALKQARRCLAWACEQRPEFQAEYDAVDAVIAKATGESK